MGYVPTTTRVVVTMLTLFYFVAEAICKCTNHYHCYSKSKFVEKKFKENENIVVFSTLAIPWYLFLLSLSIKRMQTTGSISQWVYIAFAVVSNAITKFELITSLTNLRTSLKTTSLSGQDKTRQDLFYSAQFYRTFRLKLQRQLNTVQRRNKRKKKNVTIN